MDLAHLQLIGVRAVGQGVRVFDPTILLAPERITFGDGVRIDSFVKIEGGRGVSIGAGVHVPSFCLINSGGGEVHIGNEAGLAAGCIILGGTSDPGWPSMSAAAGPGRWRASRDYVTLIGPRAFLGARSVVMPGVVIGADAVIGAGAVVTHDVPPGQVWVGVPARFRGWRIGHGPGAS